MMLVSGSFSKTFFSILAVLAITSPSRVNGENLRETADGELDKDLTRDEAGSRGGGRELKMSSKHFANMMVGFCVDSRESTYDRAWINTAATKNFQVCLDECNKFDTSHLRAITVDKAANDCYCQYENDLVPANVPNPNTRNHGTGFYSKVLYNTRYECYPVAVRGGTIYSKADPLRLGPDNRCLAFPEEPSSSKTNYLEFRGCNGGTGIHWYGDSNWRIQSRTHLGWCIAVKAVHGIDRLVLEKCGSSNRQKFVDADLTGEIKYGNTKIASLTDITKCIAHHVPEHGVTDIAKLDSCAPKYIGCFPDKSWRAMTWQNQPNEYSIQGCADLCEEYFDFAGLQWYGSCFCGNHGDYNRWGGARPETECNTRCKKGSGICGGAWRNSVYETTLNSYYLSRDFFHQH